MQNIHPSRSEFKSKNAQVPKPKKLNSSKSLRAPGIGTGAFPDRLRSPGTANTAQTTIRTTGIAIPTRYELPDQLYPQRPAAKRQINSKTNLTAKFSR